MKLALPLLMGQVAGVGMAATDVLFAGHLGPKALTAVAVSINFDVLLMALTMGVFMASAAVVAQRRGAGVAPAAIGAYLRGTLRLALLLGLGLNALVYVTAPLVLSELIADPETVALAVDYLRTFSFCSIGACLWYALRFVAEGAAGERPVLLAGLAGLVINALANPLFIHGFGPLPALGLQGSALATVTAYSAMPLCLAWFCRRHPALRALGLFDSAHREAGAGRLLLRVGLPVGLILAAEAGLFVAVSLMMTRVGDAAVAAHQVALNAATVFFMIPAGIGLASTVRVGYAAGAGDRLAARRAGLVGLGLATGVAAVNALVMMAVGEHIALLYTGSAAIAGLAASLLWVGGVFQLADSVQTVCGSALRGLADTRVPMQLTLLGFWGLGVPMAWWLGFHRHLGAVGLWWGLVAGAAAVGAMLASRFLACTRAPDAAVSGKASFGANGVVV